MASVVSAIRNTVSISLFNRGLAGKIFSDVKRTGAKVVMKNNLPVFKCRIRSFIILTQPLEIAILNAPLDTY